MSKIDLKTSEAILALFEKGFTENPNSMGKITCSIYINQFLSILNTNKYTLSEVKEYREDFLNLFEDLCYLRSRNIIKTQHVKDILEYGWEHPYFDLCEYFISKKILDVLDDDVIRSSIKVHLSNSPKIVEQFKNGKTQVAGSIIGLLKKEFGNKFNPSDAMAIITDEIGKI